MSIKHMVKPLLLTLAVSLFALTLTALVLGQAALPIISAVEPTVLPYTGGTITVLGGGFQPGAVVRIISRGVLATTHVNTGTLTALVPAGEPAGTYSLQVSNPDGQSATLQNALRIQGPPQPTSPPVPGRPVLTVRNYSVSPQRPYAGSTFVLRIEVYNTGSRGAENSIVKFPGGQLIPVGPNAGYLLGAIGINETRIVTQSIRVPSGATGPSSVSVVMSANDYEGNHYDFQETLAIDVPAGGVSGRPQVTLMQASSQPADLAPGQSYSLTLVLKNQGNTSANGVALSVVSGGLSLPSEQASTVSVDRIAVGATVTAVLPLRLTEAAGAGRQAQTVHIEYGDYASGRYSGDFNVTLAVSADLSTRPQLVLETYRTDPETLAPGNPFTLTLTLDNVGGGAAQRVTLTIGGATSATSTGLGPFAPLESGNVKFLGRLDAGRQQDMLQRFVVDGQAQAGVYQLPITIEYDDPRGSRKTDTQVISLIVIRAPLMRVGLLEPITQTLLGQPIETTIEIINIGQYAVNVNRVELSSGAMDITQGASTYIGPMDSGTSQTVQTTAMPRQAGPAAITVTINYVDDLNRPQQIAQALQFNVLDVPQIEPTPAPPQSEGGVLEWIGKLLRGLLGLGS